MKILGKAVKTTTKNWKDSQPETTNLLPWQNLKTETFKKRVRYLERAIIRTSSGLSALQCTLSERANQRFMNSLHTYIRELGTFKAKSAEMSTIVQVDFRTVLRNPKRKMDTVQKRVLIHFWWISLKYSSTYEEVGEEIQEAIPEIRKSGKDKKAEPRTGAHVSIVARVGVS